MIHIHQHEHIKGYKLVFSEDGDLLGTLEQYRDKGYFFHPAQGVLFFTQKQLETLAQTMKDMNR